MVARGEGWNPVYDRRVSGALACTFGADLAIIGQLSPPDEAEAGRGRSKAGLQPARIIFVRGARPSDDFGLVRHI